VKVFIMTKPPFGAIGGYAAYGRNLAKCLIACGYEPHFVVLGPSEKDEKTPVGFLHQVNAVSSRLGTAGYNIWSHSFAQKIAKLVAPNESFVAHSVGTYGVAGVYLKERFRNRMLLVTSHATTIRDEVYWMVRGITRHDYDSWTLLKYRIAGRLLLSSMFLNGERKLLQACDAIIVHYSATRVIIRRDYGIESEKFFKIPYYVELFERDIGQAAARETRDLISDEPVIITVCRQDPRKGINYWLHAVKNVLSQRKVRVIIIGGGPLLAKHMSLARKLGIQESVTFTGAIRDLRPYLEAADIFVLPSLQEGSGSLSLLEAMSSGLPVVTTTCSGGIPEDVKNEFNGLLVPPENPRALSNAVLRLINNKQERSRIGENAKTSYAERFSLPAMSKGVSDIYASFGFLPSEGQKIT
jgi:glycosyltransferase involved in cell wall biosynthesis